MMIEHDEMNEAKFLYACASMKVAIASFLEVCEVYGCASDGLVKMLDESREAIDGLMRAWAVRVLPCPRRAGRRRSRASRATWGPRACGRRFTARRGVSDGAVRRGACEPDPCIAEGAFPVSRVRGDRRALGPYDRNVPAVYRAAAC